MANQPKNGDLAAIEPCALYYFPEIPCGSNRANEASEPSGSFNRAPFKGQNSHSPEETDPQSSATVQSLIQEAFNQGLEQGRTEMIASHKEKINKAATALEAGIQEMHRIRQRDVEQLEAQTVRLALAIVRKIIGNAIEHQSVVQHVVRQAMEKVNDTRHLVLKLNPKDLGAIEELRQDLMPADDFGADFRIEADEGIQRGGCIIETQLGDIDARIDRQINIIEELLVDQLPKYSIQND